MSQIHRTRLHLAESVTPEHLWLWKAAGTLTDMMDMVKTLHAVLLQMQTGPKSDKKKREQA